MVCGSLYTWQHGDGGGPERVVGVSFFSKFLCASEQFAPDGRDHFDVVMLHTRRGDGNRFLN